MTKSRKHLPAKLGAVFLIVAMAAALLSSSALAALPESDVYATVTQGVNSYVQLTSFYEYTVDCSELGTGAYPPGMQILETGDTVALTGAPTQAGTYTGTGTVFYRSNDGGHDEQAPFNFTITVEAAATPAPTAAPTASPTTAPTAKPTSATTAPTAAPSTKPTTAPSGVPKVTKSPTGETVSEGGSCIFIARADGATGYTWYCTAADGSVYTMAQAKTSFPGLSVSGDGTTTLALSNIPSSLSGASFYCNFSNSAGDVKSGSATVTVTAKTTPKPTEKPDEPINQNTHDHNFHSEWSYDEEAHWHDCDCGSRDGYEPHRVSDWATKNDGSLLGVCDVCGASVTSAGDATTAPETTPEATPEATPDAKEKPALGGNKTEPKKGSAVTVLLVVLLVVLLLLLGAIVFFILRSRRASNARKSAPRAKHSQFKPENKQYNPRHDGINDEYDRQEYERRKNAEHDNSVQ